MGSGGYTYAQLKQAVELTIARFAGDGRNFVNPLVPNWVNDAYHEIDRKLRWTRCTYDILTVDGTDEYVVPSSVREYLWVKFVDAEGHYYTLEPLTIGEWVKKQGSSTAENEPRFYVQHGDRIYLYPCPDADSETVTIYVVGEPPRLADDSDKPGFPVHLHQLVVQKASAMAMRHLGMFDEAMQQDLYIEQRLDDEKKASAIQRGGSGRVQHRGP